MPLPLAHDWSIGPALRTGLAPDERGAAGLKPEAPSIVLKPFGASSRLPSGSKRSNPTAALWQQVQWPGLVREQPFHL